MKFRVKLYGRVASRSLDQLMAVLDRANLTCGFGAITTTTASALLKTEDDDGPSAEKEKGEGSRRV